ncbi:hypothetical protein PYCC9005_004704 [Savitreella phatthalungensis]
MSFESFVQAKEELCARYAADNAVVANVCSTASIALWTLRPIVGQLSSIMQRLTADAGSLLGIGSSSATVTRSNADLTSVVLLLVSLYFGFVMLVRTTRMVYGSRIYTLCIAARLTYNIRHRDVHVQGAFICRLRNSWFGSLQGITTASQVTIVHLSA